MKEAKASDDDDEPGSAPHHSSPIDRVAWDHLSGEPRNRVDNAHVWGRRERLQRFLGSSIRLDTLEFHPCKSTSIDILTLYGGPSRVPEHHGRRRGDLAHRLFLWFDCH